MLSFLEIANAVSELVKERCGGIPVYMERVPLHFERPSCLVELGPVEMESASCSCVEIKLTAVVTLFVDADEYHNSHVPELMKRMADVQELFAADGLRVGGRTLRVIADKGNCQFDYAEVSVTFQYQDDRPGGEDYPLMASVQTTIKEE